MKIHLLSDLHLELSSYPYDQEALRQADVVVLAGDIDVGTAGLFFAEELLQVAPHLHVVYVAGNHEFYGFDLPKTLASFQELMHDHPQIHFLENQEVMIGGVRFLGATLWTDFKLYTEGPEDDFGVQLNKEAAKFGLNDFSAIFNTGRLFTTDDALALHRESAAWLREKLDTPFDGKTVVVTHHAPSEGSVAARFYEHPLTPCFVSQLDHLVAQADLWLHGHTHDSFAYNVGGTRVVCNPRGYAYDTNSLPENLDFRPDLLIEI
ncbi:MAG: metallophosphoesterase family protein [Betaproteobacteria bacterium]|nr:metallophosphoesterase family protein [Betaproteobacteria bacterium]